MAIIQTNSHLQQTPLTNEDGGYVADAANPGRYKMQEIPHDIGGTVLPTIGITVEF